MLGIGVVTYNRRETVARVIEGVKQHTRSPYRLLVADDGSTDGTIDLLAAQGVEYLTGPNGGPGINKNRLLLAFMELTKCDPILLLEDDVVPSSDWWEAHWIAAGNLIHHCNVVLPMWYPWFADKRKPGGDGTPFAPWWWEGFTGQATVTSRWALSQVGYLDPLLKGFGEEHVEWTRRFGRLLKWPVLNDWHGEFRWGGVEVPQIDAPGLTFVDAGTYYDGAQTAANQEIHALIKDGPIYRPPARTRQEIDALSISVGGLLVRRARQWNPGMGYNDGEGG